MGLLMHISQLSANYSERNFREPPFNVPAIFDWDPVDMATGAFVFDRTDLEAGLGGARGLTFARHYSSNRRAIDTPGIGYGWTHNYHMQATRRTAPEAGLGETTPS